MKRSLLVLALFMGIALQGFAQLYPPDTVRGRLLNEAELKGKKWYYSLEEALANPEDVYKLSLQGQKIKVLPPEIASLTNLQVLDLADNKIKVLPPEIEHLTHLQVVTLYDNKLKALPDQVRHLVNLHSLYLSKNKLNVVPIWVGGLGKLRRLDLSRNRFTPYEISRIQSLLPKVEITY